MLVALHHALDRRFGLTPEERRHFRQVYGDPWVMVRDLLGHGSEQTTRLLYLEPLNGLQVHSMLGHDEDLEALLSRVAASSRLVIDVGPGGGGLAVTGGRYARRAALLRIRASREHVRRYRSVLDGMTVPDDMPGAGEDGLDIYRVPVLKRRRPPRTRHTSANLVDDGPDTSGRLIRQAIEATEPARITLAALGEPTARLLASRRASPAGPKSVTRTSRGRFPPTSSATRTRPRCCLSRCNCCLKEGISPRGGTFRCT